MIYSPVRMAAALTFAALLAAASSSTHAGVIRVGATAGRGCDFAAIDQAVAEAQRRWDNHEGPQEIRIARDAAWTNVNVLIKDMDLRIFGGLDYCDSTASQDQTTVSGAGGAGAPVFSIEGPAQVNLQDLYITGGDAHAGRGGGIDYIGQGGVVYLKNVTLTRNVGGEGGAIRFAAVGSGARLHLDSDVSMTNNQAVDYGGAIYLVGEAIDLRTGPGVVINDNTVTAGHGGGIAVNGHATLELYGSGSELKRNTASGNGGGIDFEGGGSVTLDGFAVESNVANYGGGLHMAGGLATFGPSPAGTDTPRLRLTIADDVSISGNTARKDGGGLHLERSVLLDMAGMNTSVTYNNAAERGGGLAIEGPALAYVGAAGPWPGKAVFHYNGAQHGGGIAVLGGTYAAATGKLYLYTAHPDYPMTLSENTASNGGGAVYGVGKAGKGSARLCIQDTSMYANRAVQGAAVLADTDNFAGVDGQSAQLEINGSQLCQFPPDARHCEGPLCNQVTFNFSGFAGGTRTSGAVFETGEARQCGGAPCDTQPQQVVGGVVMRNNSTGSLAKGRLPIVLQNVVGYDNDLITALADGNVDVLHGSFAGNTRSAFALSLFNGAVRSSLFMMSPGQKLLTSFGGGTVSVTHVTSDDLTGAPPHASNVLSSDPGFVDAQAPGFDLHLRQNAAVIDTAPAPAGLLQDLERHERTVDVPARVDQYGPADRGAYEFQVSPLLRDGFEQRN